MKEEKKESKHKYSSIVLIIICCLIIFTALVSSIEGFGTKNYIPKFMNGEFISNSLMYENGSNVYINGSKICTNDSSDCITTITNNITINITNNYTSPELAGIKNETQNVETTMSESYWSNPFFSYGCYNNYLFQTESFEQVAFWVVRNGTGISANGAVSPIGTMIAENILGNIPVTHTYQNITHTSKDNLTFSVWMRSYLNKGDNIVGLKLTSNNASYVVLEKNFTLTPYWKRYSVTTDFYYAHQLVNVSIINGINNISVWGAQLENSTTARMYGAPRTTTANAQETCGAYARGGWTYQSNLFTSGVSLGGALSGATTGAFSGTITSTFSSTLNNLVLYAYILTTSASTSAVQFQGAPLLSFRSTMWDGTATSNQEFNFGTKGNNNTKEISLVLFNKNAQGFNKTIVNITSSINSTVYPISILWANNTVHKFFANDNTTQLMCLNVSRSGNVTAYKC